MRKLFRLTVLGLMMGIFVSSFGFAKETIVISGCEWEPYNGKKLLNQGFFTEISVEALKHAGYSPQVEIIPWKRALEGTKNGLYHALMGASFTQERTQFFSYPEYAWINKINFFSLKGNEITFQKADEICSSQPKKLKVGVLRGSFLVKKLSVLDCIKIDEANSVKNNFKKLLAGHISLIMDSQDAVFHLLNKDFPTYKDKISTLNPPYVEDKVYCVFSKKKPEYEKLTADFDRGIQIIKDNGIYKTILKKHGMQ